MSRIIVSELFLSLSEQISIDSAFELKKTSTANTEIAKASKHKAQVSIRDSESNDKLFVNLSNTYS